MDEEIISLEELDKLPEYSCTIPTGRKIGKRWKRAADYYAEKTDWIIGEFIGKNSIKWTWAVIEPGLTHKRVMAKWFCGKVWTTGCKGNGYCYQRYSYCAQCKESYNIK